MDIRTSTNSLFNSPILHRLLTSMTCYFRCDHNKYSLQYVISLSHMKRKKLAELTESRDSDDVMQNSEQSDSDDELEDLIKKKAAVSDDELES